MDIFERIAQHFGCTFNVHFARSQCLKFIPMQKICMYGLYTLIAAAAILLIVWLIRHWKKN